MNETSHKTTAKWQFSSQASSEDRNTSVHTEVWPCGVTCFMYVTVHNYPTASLSDKMNFILYPLPSLPRAAGATEASVRVSPEDTFTHQLTRHLSRGKILGLWKKRNEETKESHVLSFAPSSIVLPFPQPLCVRRVYVLVNVFVCTQDPCIMGAFLSDGLGEVDGASPKFPLSAWQYSSTHTCWQRAFVQSLCHHQVRDYSVKWEMSFLNKTRAFKDKTSTHYILLLVYPVKLPPCGCMPQHTIMVQADTCWAGS